MKSTSFALGALMASVAIAQPHRHQHQAMHHKRNEEVVWVTDWDYVTETVGITTTVWVSEGFVPPTPATQAATTSTSSSSSSTSLAKTANQFFENASKAKPTTSTSIYVAPTPESTYVAPVPTSTYVAPTTLQPEPTPTPTSTSVYVAPTSAYVAPVVETTSSSAYVAPAAETTAAPVAAAVTTQSSSSSGSTGGVCSSGSPCEGDITYYEAGLGACGETSNGNVDKVIALPVGMMGSQSNGNPYCGKTVTIKKGSKTVTATVIDKCMGCTGNSIDLSNAAFEELADFSVGRTTAEWWFN